MYLKPFPSSSFLSLNLCTTGMKLVTARLVKYLFGGEKIHDICWKRREPRDFSSLMDFFYPFNMEDKFFVSGLILTTLIVFGRMQCCIVPDRCVPEQKVSDVPSHEQFFPWTMRPLDDASLGFSVPDRPVLTLDRIGVLLTRPNLIQDKNSCPNVSGPITQGHVV